MTIYSSDTSSGTVDRLEIRMMAAIPWLYCLRGMVTMYTEWRRTRRNLSPEAMASLSSLSGDNSLSTDGF